MKRIPVTLALGGGGARGLAHIGVLAELERSCCQTQRIVGTSMGSLIGAMYAFEPDAAALQQRATKYLMSPEFLVKQQYLLQFEHGHESDEAGKTWYQHVTRMLHGSRLMVRAVRRPSFLPATMLNDVVNHLLPDADIADARIPLHIAAVDLHSGREAILREGSVRLAVRASASLPGIFPPVKWGNMLLSDLGVLVSLPAIAARRAGSDPVIIVDVGPKLRELNEELSSLQVLMRMIEVGEAMSREPLRRLADLLITPAVGEIPWYDFSQTVRLIELGREAAHQALSQFSPNVNSLWARMRRSINGLRGQFAIETRPLLPRRASIETD